MSMMTHYCNTCEQSFNNNDYKFICPTCGTDCYGVSDE